MKTLTSRTPRMRAVTISEGLKISLAYLTIGIRAAVTNTLKRFSFGGSSKKEHQLQRETSKTPVKQPKMRKFKTTKATANIVVVTMETLDKETTMMTGDAVFCHGCQGAISAVSTVTDAKNDKFSWTW